MKPHLLLASLFSAWVALAGLSHLPSGGLPVMVEKANADDSGKALRAPSVPPARGPSAAVAEEYELARRKGTAEALELFIARHPDSPEAQKARADLAAMGR
ncbi:hypothetical protein [Bradyrhizobium sp.]|jgi:hypothetical protein|uniref:hypothetical protein n=1 Tax=Bradyrhizobium sp. TaxID=376 RepID=UPI002DDD7B10|nr:hypothetical protein [Bradyrhizobium sp.]HEV2154842.1 hypothetical protein [Bradyrhizobium sp.]